MPCKILLPLLCILAAAMVGCGGGDVDSTQSGSTSGTQSSQEGTHGAAQFRTPGSDNSIQESGREAGRAERDQAAAALHGFLDAGPGRNWQAACRYFSSRAAAQLGAAIGLNGKACPEVLAALFAGASREDFVKAAEADVGSFRINGRDGYLLYHGAEDSDYAMPMILEGGRWKVAAPAGSALV